jgi:tRNA uridine 5-carboxymethylaminomethyl modification enzyme
MALATDGAGIQFRTLNSSKGPAVRATAAQADRLLYKQAIRTRLERQPNLTLFQQAVDEHPARRRPCRRCRDADRPAFPRTNHRSHGWHLPRGADPRRHGELRGRARRDPAAITLAARLRDMQLPVGRLKTGTPPRLDGNSIDFSALERQPGDVPEPVFSFMGRREMHPRQLPCWVTHTNERTHAIIRAGLDRSPMYTGVIQGVGPRYCPSIEDKIHRFAGKAGHQIFSSLKA